MSAQWLRAVSDRRLSLCSSFCCWNWKCLNYSGKKIQCDEDSGCDGLSSVKIQYCVLTKAVKLSSTRRLLRAVSSFGLHGAPCFFGAGPASKLCIRITTQAHTTFRKPANAQAHIFFLNSSSIWKFERIVPSETYWLINEEGVIAYLLCISFCICSSFQKWHRLFPIVMQSQSHKIIFNLHSSQRRCERCAEDKHPLSRT